jgi:CBS domain-containing protein
VIDFIERSHDNTLPVVDQEGGVVGIIRYADLRDEHFDPGLGPLVRAADLALMSFPRLHADQSAMDAWREFRHCRDDCLPVVDRDRPYRLVGVLRRRDIFQFTSRAPNSN